MNSRQRAIALVLAPLLYYAGAIFANEFMIFTKGAVVLWPPNSVLLAAFLILGRRDFILLILCTLCAEIAADIPFIPWEHGLAFGIGNVCEALTAFVLLNHWKFDRRFTTLNDLLKFIVAALVIAAFLGALIGSSLHHQFGSTEINFLENVRLYWFGDALGLMIFTPLWLSLWPFLKKKKSRFVTYRYDAVTGVAALATVYLFILSRDGEFLGVHIGPNLLLPYVVYAGARFGLRWASIGTAVVAFMTVIMMDRGYNPLGTFSARDAVIQAQEFIYITGLVSLGSAALFSKLRLQQSELETANSKLNELNHNLEARVSERTEALLQTNKQLEKEMHERHEVEHELQIANQELQRLAEIDGLTKIANRRIFDERLQIEWKRSSRERSPLSLILFDIDFFKRYNDHYGHQAGDVCLIQVAAAAAGAIKRPTDLLARYGGEEFAVILPDTDAAGAQRVIEHIYGAIRQKAIGHLCSDVSSVITISGGIATCCAEVHQAPDLIIELADQALYRAKAKGRDCYILEPPAPLLEEKFAVAN